MESIDPTDGFGSDTKIYLNNEQIIQIEPESSTSSSNSWLTDKGRQFFDGIFGAWDNKQIYDKNVNTKFWSKTMKSLVQKVYIFEHCKNQQSKTSFFVIVFENLSLELLSLLKTIKQVQPFIKVKRAENLIVNNNNLESNLQLNLNTSKKNLSDSTLCLLVSNNPRYEGFYLNLNLRQRFLKGNFKCFMLGSLIDLTFPLSFMGSNLSLLKNLFEGNSLICQEFKSAKAPLLIYNYELLKRNDSLINSETTKILRHINTLNKIWSNPSLLSPSISELTTQSVDFFSTIKSSDLKNFSSLYLLNVSLTNLPNLNKLAELKFFNQSTNTIVKNKLFINQGQHEHIEFYNKLFLSGKNLSKPSDCLFITPSTLYETEETFLNAEGMLKRTTKLIFKKQTKSNWQILRKVLKSLINSNKVLLNFNKEIITCDFKRLINFKNYIYFQYQATYMLTNVTSYLNVRNKSFTVLNKHSNFKFRQFKVKSTKLKYWLDDFFNGGKDEYSHRSLILSNCSKVLRTKATNFF